MTPEERKQYNREYYLANKEKSAAASKKRRENMSLEDRRNKDKTQYERHKSKRRQREKSRRQNDPQFAMVKRMRTRLAGVVAGGIKESTTRDLVGCSPAKLCAWLEMHFDEGMNWENRAEWHIDHIRPIASFDNPQDPECWHYTNLQPLWAKDNLKKSDRLLETGKPCQPQQGA